MVLAEAGDYERWFQEALGGERFTVVSPFLGEALPPPEDWGGVIVTGSPASVRDEAPWMARVADFCLFAAEREIPVLGVCFGHQLLGEALGGRVDRHPRGVEAGTVRVRLTEEGLLDPLFAGLPEEFPVQAIHGDELVRPPTRPGVVRLAENLHSPWQAFACGPWIRAVQFHPEVTPPVMERMLSATGLPGRAGPASGGTILRNWERSFVRRSGR